MEIAKFNGNHLTPAQKALLYNIPTANEVVFKGGQGHYNGVPIGLKLKDKAKSFHAKPYPRAMATAIAITTATATAMATGTAELRSSMRADWGLV